jgi:hypothetical protein
MEKREIKRLVDEAMEKMVDGVDFAGFVEKYIGFKKLVKQLAKKGVRDPKALAAKIGRKKYGKEKFQKMASKGRKKKVKLKKAA